MSKHSLSAKLTTRRRGVLGVSDTLMRLYRLDLGNFLEVASLVSGTLVNTVSVPGKDNHWLKVRVRSEDIKGAVAKGSSFWRAIARGLGFELTGAPIRRPSGNNLGAFCVVGNKPRYLSEGQRQMLRHFAAISEQYDLMRSTLRSIGDAIITTDAQGNVTWLNPIAEKLTGWPAHEASSKPIEIVFAVLHEDTLQPVPNPIKLALEETEGKALKGSATLVPRLGRTLIIEETSAPILDDGNRIKGAVVVFQDVTIQRRQSREMAYRATRDQLTGIANRAELQTRLDSLRAPAHTGEGPHCLMFIDLDNFKRINDSCGHLAGDQALQQAAVIFADTVRRVDLVARVGGDEFAILLENCLVADAAVVAQQICDRMQIYRYTFGAKQYQLGASIGVVEVNRNWTSTAIVMQAADSACFVAKKTGGNRVHIWRDSDGASSQRQDEIGWSARLEQAFKADQFRLFAQRVLPLDSANTGFCAKVSLRMVRPDGTFFAPEQFLRAAERFNMMCKIDRLVLSQTVSILQAQSTLADINMISVSLSALSVSDPGFHLYVLAILQAAGPILCQRIAIEITETSAFGNIHNVTVLMEKLQKLGVRVWLDDCGSGSASFDSLRAFKVDCLKIDGQVVGSLKSDPLSKVTVRALVEVAKVLGIPTLADCVERSEVLEELADLGVNFAQGFLIGIPRPIEAFFKAEL